jgi:hypothetical protein
MSYTSESWVVLSPSPVGKWRWVLWCLPGRPGSGAPTHTGPCGSRAPKPSHRTSDREKQEKIRGYNIQINKRTNERATHLLVGIKWEVLNGRGREDANDIHAVASEEAFQSLFGVDFSQALSHWGVDRRMALHLEPQQRENDTLIHLFTMHAPGTWSLVARTVPRGFSSMRPPRHRLLGSREWEYEAKVWEQ